MEITWVIEFGNTRCKCGVFNDGNFVESLILKTSIDSTPTPTPTLKKSSQVISYVELPQGNVDKIFLTGSGDWGDEVVKTLKNKVGSCITILKHGDPHPLKTLVTDPRSLGTDRIANVFAAQNNVIKEFQNANAWLIVDVGTCVTTDLIVDGMHIGGSISPGINMRLRAMNDGTVALPRVDRSVWSDYTPFNGRSDGKSTEEAMIRGSADGISAEIIGRWNILRVKFPEIGVALTGGDNSLLELDQVNPKFADSNLTLKGYHALLPHIQRCSSKD